ncbi:MAG: mannose-6-phosphate isomerase, class I [Jiangellaceae bacterium]
MVVLLENPVREYAWGSPTVIPALLGRAASGEPHAELWVGAHAGSPSTVVDDSTLDRFIAADPRSALGESACERFGPALPFLLKVLAVQRPLSIQVHPNLEQAAAGYAAEDAAGIPLDSPQRSYRDRNHKPEMALALTDFEALLGFAEPAHIFAVLEAFGHPDLDAAADLVRAAGLTRLVRRWLTLGSEETDRLVTEVAKIAAQQRAEDPFALVSRLAEDYPGDRGVLIALLMQHVRLRPGEAVFVPAGVPHAYLSGVAVEAQTSSDNTVRAGLTPKHVDVAEAMRLLRYDDHGAVAVVPIPGARGELVYVAPGVSEFRMSRVELSTEGLELPAGPRLILVLEGWADVNSGDSHCRLQRGQAAFVKAAEPDSRLAGRGVAVAVTTALDTAG